MDHNNFARVTSEPKKLFNGSISVKLVIMTLFYRKMGFNTSWRSKWVPKTYYNTLYIQILIYDQNNVARHTSEPKKPLKGPIFVKLVINTLVVAGSEFLKLVGSPSESLRLIIINYKFKYTFRIKKPLLESLRSQKSPLKNRFRQNYL